MLMTGTVTNVTQARRNSTSTGKPFTVYSLELDGSKWVQTGFNRPDYKVGDTVEFDVEETKYGLQVPKGQKVLVLTKAATPFVTPPVSSPKVTMTPAPKGGKEFPLGLLHPDRCIVRQNMLRHATEIVLRNMDATAISDEVVAKQVIEIARILESYASGYEVVEAIEKEGKSE